MANLFKKYKIDKEKYKTEPDIGQSQQAPMQNQPEMPSIPKQIYEELTKPRWDLGTTGDVLTGIETGHGEDVMGLGQTFLPGEESAGSKEAMREMQEKYAGAVERSPVATRAGYVGGKIGLPVLATAAAPLAAMAVPGQLAARAAPYAAKYAELGKNNKFLSYLKPMLENAFKGGAWGATSYVNPGETKGEHIAAGTIGGAALKPIVDAAKGLGSLPKSLVKAGYEHFFPEKTIAKDIFSKLTPDEMTEMLRVKKAAQKAGIPLTPAEASGNELVADVEAGFGKTKEGMTDLFRFKKGRKETEQQAIKDFMEGISPKTGSASKEVRKAAKEVVKENEQALQKKAAPFYEEAEKDTITPNRMNSLLRDSNIHSSFNSVLKDETYATKLKNVPRNSIKFLQYVKENLDDKIESSLRKGEKKKAGILIESKNKLVDKMDEISPNYKKARSIYTEDMPNLKELTEGNVGRIANLKGSQLKNVSKIIFDPQETDLNQLTKYRNTIGRQNPEAWHNIIKNEMERVLTTKNLEKTGSYGSNFYSQILADNNKFKQFREALGNFYNKRDTPEQKMLDNFRDAFKNLLNAKTVKTAYGQAQTSMTKPRASITYFKDELYKMFQGNYDKKAVEMITDPNWEKYVKHAFPKEDPIEVMKDPHKVLKLLKSFKKEHFEQALIKAHISKNRNQE